MQKTGCCSMTAYIRILTNEYWLYEKVVAVNGQAFTVGWLVGWFGCSTQASFRLMASQDDVARTRSWQRIVTLRYEQYRVCYRLWSQATLEASHPFFYVVTSCTQLFFAVSDADRLVRGQTLGLAILSLPTHLSQVPCNHRHIDQ